MQLNLAGLHPDSSCRLVTSTLHAGSGQIAYGLIASYARC